MSLQERTLVVKNFDSEKTSLNLLKELCLQGGPVRNVVIKPDHAFVEYEDAESVGYTKALLDGVKLFGKKLILEPKTKDAEYFKFSRLLQDYIRYDKQQKQQIQDQERLQQQMQHQQLLIREQIGFYGNQYVQPINLQQPNLDPRLQFPVNFVQNPDPQVFLQMGQSPQFPVPNQPLQQQEQQTSSRHRNDNFGRSRSFNHKHRSNQRSNQGAGNRSWSERNRGKRH